MNTPLRFVHHGAIHGVTGSCHQLLLPDGSSILVDCGLFQGAETSPDGRSNAQQLEIGFALTGVCALVVTHVHIDHVGRVPHLLAAGFKGPIVCTEASALLLPMVLEDAMEIGFAGDKALVARTLGQLRRQIVPVPYKTWHALAGSGFRLRFQPAGHILGSAYVEVDAAVPAGPGQPAATQRVVFSGDLGAPFTPLLPAPQSPLQADVVVLESTYGDRVHEGRKTRRERLQALCEHAFSHDGGGAGTVLIPAFSIGRTQELLCELEDIVFRNRQRPAAPGVRWDDLVVVVDSPLAADFTRGYMQLKSHWDEEARTQVKNGRHPLDFRQVKTVGPHELHMKVVQHLAKSAQPAIVIAASGMCSGGRIVNYLKAMLGDPRHDVLFCGYQAAGTPGRAIQALAGRGGMVELDGQQVPVRAKVHTLAGYSAHADQADLLNFVGRMVKKPRQVRLVHGDTGAKAALAALLRRQHPGMDVLVP